MSIKYGLGKAEKQPPDVIYLQWNDNDVKYVRVDILPGAVEDMIADKFSDDD